MALHKTLGLSLALLSSLVLFGDRAAADDFSCNDRIVMPGVSSLEVRTLCGPPDAVNVRVEQRFVRRPTSVPCYTPQGVSRCVVYYDAAVEVNIEDWTYDFGQHRLMRFLTFEQGKLLVIQTGGYGRKPI